MQSSKSQIPQDQFNQFIISIKSGTLQQIDEYLQKYGGEITNKLQTQLRQPSLYFAINLHDDITCLNVIKKLIAKGANVKFKDQNQQTIIFYACRDGKVQCVDYLVSLGVSLFQQDAYGQTPLYYIANQNQINLVSYYDRLQYYNHVDKLAQQTPLYYAAKKGYLQMCKLLIENGCDVTHHDSHNKTAVQYARRARYHQVTQYLSGQIKKTKQTKIQQPQQQPIKEKETSKPQQQQNQHQQQSKKVQVPQIQPKKQMVQVQSVSNVPRSFYKIVYINDQGQTKQLTQQDIRSLVRQKPNLQALLANPNRIPKQALENQRDEQQKQGEKWQKVAARVMTTIWKHKGSGWFQQPVDPVKFGIMDYNDIITHPMDLGTIKKKLAHNFYSNVKQFAGDIRLVWDNCYKYNGYEHQISLCAKQLQKLFNQIYAIQLKGYE